MSLLVVSGANRVAQGLIRGLHSSGKYEKIVCADVFPNYRATQRYLHFKDSLGASPTKLVEAKISEKSDLEALLRGSSHVVYVTHDYYANVPSKLNLIKHTATLSKAAGVKKLLAVLPIENDHQAEQNAAQAVADSEAEARLAFPELSILKTDLTFGHDSNVIQAIISRIATGQSLCFKPSSASVSPVHSINVAAAAQKILESASAAQNVLAQGSETLTWNAIVEILASALGKQAVLNQNTIDSIVSPLGNNLLSQTLHCGEYSNLAQFINQYANPKNGSEADLASLGVSQLTKFSEFYKVNSLNPQDYQPRAGTCSIAACL